MTNEQIKAYREQKLGELHKRSAAIEEVVTENFEAVCKIAIVAQIHGDSFKIETPYGEVIVHPKPNL